MIRLLSTTSGVLLVAAASLASQEPVQPEDPRAAELRGVEDRIVQASEHLHQLHQVALHTRKELAELEAEYEIALLQEDWRGWSGELGLERMTRSETELDHTAVKIETLQVRSRAIQHKMAELEQEIEDRIEGDELLGEMREIVRMQTQLLEQRVKQQAALREKGVTSEHMSAMEVASARLDLLESRINLENRELALRERHGGRSLDKLRDDLVEVEIELEVEKARHDRIESRLVEMGEKLAKLREFRISREEQRIELQQHLLEIESEIQNAERERLRLEEHAQQLRRKLGSSGSC